ncbi:MAG: ABC transporter permease subunit [Negativicutes bacterium]|nr:ABC transporter permease subunit [Negativicutes bacterium]
MNSGSSRQLAAAGVYAVVLGWLLAFPGQWQGLCYRLLGTSPGLSGLSDGKSLLVLTGQHLAVVAASAALATVIGTLIALANRTSRTTTLSSAAAALSGIPSIIILSLTLPVTGYGKLPAIIALTLWSMVPVANSCRAAINSVPASLLETGQALGLTGRQIWLKIIIPAAWPTYKSGLRVMLVSNISAATLASVVGAGGLGTAVFAGIKTFDTVLLISGTTPIVLLALIADKLLEAAP